MKSAKIWLQSSFIFVFGLLCLTCQQNSNVNLNSVQKKAEITVSAAASLQIAFREIAELYEPQTNVKVNFNFASSGVLQKQIEQGAPADVFASAGQEQMDALADKNLIDSKSRLNFAQNQLVLIGSSKTENANLSFAQYLELSAEKIAIGNPKTVPVGRYAEQTLKNLNLLEKLQSRFVFGEDVRQVLDYVERGEAQFGIVYVSDVFAAREKVRGLMPAPENSHDPIFYPIAVIKITANREAAQKFIDFVSSADGQKILQENGFQSVK